MLIYLPMKKGVRKRFDNNLSKFEVEVRTEEGRTKWKTCIPTPTDVIRAKNMIKSANKGVT